MGMYTGNKTYDDYKELVRKTFTPNDPAEGKMYVSRDEIDESGGSQGSLQEAIGDTLLYGGFQILLYGDSGVGKTNLITWICSKNNIKKALVNVREGQSCDDIVERAVKKVAGDIDIETGGTSGRTRQRRAALLANLKSVVPFLGAGEVGVEGDIQWGVANSVNTKKLSIDLPELLARSMYETGTKLLVFDNLQNLISAESRSEVGALMEYFADLSQEFEEWEWHPKIAVAGIPSNGVDLIEGNKSRARRIKQFKIEHMKDDAISKIVTTGFNILDVSVSQSLIDEIVFYSDGFPYFTHQLCQGAALGRNVFETRELSMEELRSAISGMFESERDEMRSLLKLARGRRSDKRVRAKVLEIIVESSWPEWSSRQVLNKWHAKYPDAGTTRHGDITAKLNEMSVGEGKMNILVRSGTEAEYEYRFHDPHFRPYARMHPEVDDGDS